MHVRTLAAILLWFVVALLLLNRLLKSEYILPISIVLTVIAVLIYFSPRFRRNPKPQSQPAESNFRENHGHQKTTLTELR
jgi:heme/copper-type cytochrome/quinol oxidase subunit 2